MTSPRVPQLLEPYLSLPSPASLTLITAVLGATHNWLIARVLAVTLESGDRRENDDGEYNGMETAAVLVSFMRDREFWKFEASRVVSLLRSPGF